MTASCDGVVFFAAFWLLHSPLLHAQDSEDESASEDSGPLDAVDESEVMQSLDESPWVSPRALGMGGALSTLADGYDAPFHNPAGIGGLQWTAPKKKSVRNLYFPLSGFSLNENSYELRQEFASNGGTDNSTVGEALVDAAAGKRQYGRVSNMLGLGISRLIVIPYMDQQGAVIPEGSEGNVNGKFNLTTGYGAGFSASDPNGRLFLGAFAFSESRTTYKGSFAYRNLVNAEERSGEIKDSEYRYSAQGFNAGMIYRVPKGLNPSVAAVLRNAGDTDYRLTKAPDSDPAAASETVKQDLTLGFSVSPKFGKSGYWNWIVESHHLLHEDMEISRKLRIGTEYSLGGFGYESILALRGGYSSAGPSAGMAVNLGIINFEASFSSVEAGHDNQTVSERRISAVIYVDVSE